jgi:hypothetical protein
MKYGMLIAAAVAAVAFVVAPVVAQEEGKQDFTLVNKTGYVISEVYVSPSKADDWQEDVLGQDTLDDASSVDIHFHRSTHACKWDLKVVYKVDNTSAEWHDFDLCSVSKITIHYNEKTEETSATYE